VQRNKPALTLLILALILVIFIFSCSNKHKEGEKIARQYCSGCHQFPEPASLNKTTWANYVLPAMGSMMGFRHLPSGGYVEFKNDENLSLTDWNKLISYYIASSPKQLPGPAVPIPVSMSLEQFDVVMPPSQFLKPSTTFVGVESNGKGFYFGDGSSGKAYAANADGMLLDSLESEKGIVQMGKNDFGSIRDSAGVIILTMGVLHPSDETLGRVIFHNAATGVKSILIDSLQRPVHASFTDLNNDRLEDIVIAEFGNTKGKLCWHEQLENGTFQPHILSAKPGAVKTFTGDYNADSKTDIVALMAQGNEGVFIYYNQGNGHFRQQQLIQFPASYGCNSMEMADINKDGFNDLIVSNGDNGDYPPLLKPYHGVRIFINNGKFEFTEKAFLHVNGIGKVIARDFDKDGDLDLATIAYFPDFENKPEEAFIYWQNNGGLSFKPFSFANVSVGRWLTMDAGDIDGDGDMDIILGNAYFTLGYIPEKLKRKWDVGSPSVILLINKQD
jgi:hypothetical protein